MWHITIPPNNTCSRASTPWIHHTRERHSYCLLSASDKSCVHRTGAAFKSDAGNKNKIFVRSCRSQYPSKGVRSLFSSPPSMPPHTRRNPPRNSGLTATRNGAVSAKDSIGPMRACVFTAKIRVLGTQFMHLLGFPTNTPRVAPPHGWWIHGVLARLQVLLGGTVVCHIRFSTMADTMMVVYIGLRFFPDKLAAWLPSQNPRFCLILARRHS